MGGGRPPKPGADGVQGQYVIIDALIEGQFSFTDHQSRQEMINMGACLEQGHLTTGLGSNHWKFSMIVHTPVHRKWTLIR